MNLVLKFDFSTHIVYVPDGYITDISKFQTEFFEWLYDQSEYMIQTPNGNLAFRYDENAVLKYINGKILYDSNEKAYFIQKPARGNVSTLKF